MELNIAIRVRPATPADAEAATALVRASITELCVADHQNDLATLERWLANKQPHIFERWRNDPNNHLVVAERADSVAASSEPRLACVGCVNVNGEILLCYAHPRYRGTGAGSAVLRELEAQAVRWNLSELRLSSTSGARAFYERHGFVSTGQARPGFGVLVSYPYAKSLRR